MRRYFSAAVASVLIAASSAAQPQRALVTVLNTAPLARESESIQVPLRDLSALRGEPGSTLVVRSQGSSAPVVSQVIAGYLLFQSDFSPGEKKEFTVTREKSSGPSPEPRVAGMFVLPREDYAWENDRIAFRMYGPALAAEVNNGIDVWTKRTRSLVVAKWYREAESAPAGHDPYHADRGEGADFFDVGRSLGAGGCALWDGGKVHQPGVFSSWKTLANGPIRTEFELLYGPVTIRGEALKARMTVALDAGQNLNRIQVTYEGRRAGENVLVACGLVKRAATTISSDAYRGWIGLWGPTNRDPVNGSLGTGVVIGRSGLLQFAQDSVHYLVIAEAVTGEPFTYYAGAGWTRSGDVATREEWNAMLDRRARLIDSPLRVSCIIPE